MRGSSMEIDYKKQERITRLALNLRWAYYKIHCAENCTYDHPFDTTDNMEESIGAWPEFIFRGTFCSRTFQRLCSPCFYSRFPNKKYKNKKVYYEMIP